MLRVIAFNGPPHSGKDTIANALAAQLEAACVKTERVAFSMPMRLAVAALLGVEYSLSWYETQKDVIQPISGRTVREMMIDLSERHVKPLYGQEYWCKAAMNRVNEKTKFALISDLGFWPEVEYLEKHYGPRQVLTVNIARANCDWTKDSRTSIWGDNSFVLDNNGTVIAAATRLRNYLKATGWLTFSPIEQ